MMSKGSSGWREARQEITDLTHKMTFGCLVIDDAPYPQRRILLL